jgi:Spy/CpxP family protein refolding chaperone
MAVDSGAPRELPPALQEQLAELIITELRAGGPARFKRAAKVCERAHQLLSMYVSRVDDEENLKADAHEDAMGNYLQPRHGVVGGAMTDRVDETREVLSALLPLMQAFTRQQMQQELDLNLRLRAMAVTTGLDPARIDAKIRELSDRLATRGELNGVDVANPEFLRRCAVAGDGVEAVCRDGGATDVAGAGGIDPARDGGAPERMAAPIDSIGTRCVDGATVNDGQCADREGGGAHREGAQAG